MIQLTQRKPLSVLFGLSLSIRLATEEDVIASDFGVELGDVVIYRRDNGDVVALVDIFDIYDRDGEHFDTSSAL